jgi:ATP-dependent protease ClpP protease subunit
MRQVNRQAQNFSQDDYDEPSGQFSVMAEPLVVYGYKININRPILGAWQFEGAVEVLQRATEDDGVLINLQTPGGSVDATDMLVQAMADCPAHIHTKASGGVCSAGTVILLNSDSFELSKNFYALIHNGSTGSVGKYSDYAAEVVFSTKHHENFIRNSYEGFLTEEEIDALLKGKDFWMEGKEFGSRYEARQAFLVQKHGCNNCNTDEKVVDE